MNFALDPLVQKNISLQGSFSHNWPTWEKVIGLMAARRIDVRPMISRVAPLEDWKSCFDGMHRGPLFKIVSILVELIPSSPRLKAIF